MEAEEGNTRARNKEAILTAGMGYGKRKRELLSAVWSIVWPRLEKIGWKRVSDEQTMLNYRILPAVLQI